VSHSDELGIRKLCEADGLLPGPWRFFIQSSSTLPIAGHQALILVGSVFGEQASRRKVGLTGPVFLQLPIGEGYRYVSDRL
jgi:hypothetical protein